MSTTRKLPDSDIGRQRALNIAMSNLEILDSADKILSTETTLRLIDAHKQFNDGIKAIVATSSLYHRTVELARPQRALLSSYVRSFFASVKSHIRIHKMVQADRVYYNLAITNLRLPDISSDDKLLEVSATIISGDLKRCAEGGVEMSAPTIGEFIEIFNTAAPIINAITNTTTNMLKALSLLKEMHEEVDDVIDHVWGEVEAKYSKNSLSNRRGLCRLWGVRYIIRGTVWLLAGICLDSISNELVCNVKLHLVGAKGDVKGDINGHFSVHTTLYGDLELMAKADGYEDKVVFFIKEKGLVKLINVVMVKVIKEKLIVEEIGTSDLNDENAENKTL